MLQEYAASAAANLQAPPKPWKDSKDKGRGVLHKQVFPAFGSDPCSRSPGPHTPGSTQPRTSAEDYNNQVRKAGAPAFCMSHACHQTTPAQLGSWVGHFTRALSWLEPRSRGQRRNSTVWASCIWQDVCACSSIRSIKRNVQACTCTAFASSG